MNFLLEFLRCTVLLSSDEAVVVVTTGIFVVEVEEECVVFSSDCEGLPAITSGSGCVTDETVGSGSELAAVLPSPSSASFSSCSESSQIKRALW